MGYRRGYWRRDPHAKPLLKPWEREYPGQYVCRECHTAWDCSHASDITVLVICSKCGLGKDCVRCKRYQPKKSGLSRLYRSQMPNTWRDKGKWLCASCRPEHEPVAKAGNRIMACEECRGVPQVCEFFYPEPFQPHRDYWRSSPRR